MHRQNINSHHHHHYVKGEPGGGQAEAEYQQSPSSSSCERQGFHLEFGTVLFIVIKYVLCQTSEENPATKQSQEVSRCAAPVTPGPGQDLSK